MRRIILLFIAFTTAGIAVSLESTFENSNFTISAPLDGTGAQKIYNYNRFRATEFVRKNDWFLTVIGDIDNYLGRDTINSASYIAASEVRSDTPFVTQTEGTNYGEGEFYAQLYRFYGGYVDAKHRISFGLQKVSMGVGRIWNPTDLFNPKNPLALEPDEVYGVFALSYTYALSDLSQITAVVAEREDHSFKYAGRIKGYIEIVDVALDLVSADDVSMIGYEIEGEWFQTGIAVRSEGGYFDDKLLKKEYFQGIVGADYTFENSFSLIAEWLYSSQSFEKEPIPSSPSEILNNLMPSKNYGGLVAGYEFDTLLYGGPFRILCQSGKITNTQGHRYEDRNRRRAICSRY
jgi:hypothetical protein